MREEDCPLEPEEPPEGADTVIVFDPPGEWFRDATGEWIRAGDAAWAERRRKPS